MSARVARKIYQDFQTAVVTAGEEYSVAFPDALLRHSKEKNKQAIKVWATYLKSAKKLDPATVIALRADYAAIGKFTLEADADFVRDYNNSLKTEVSTGFAEKTKRSQFITNKVRIQEADSAQEFRAWFSRLMKDRPLGDRTV